MSSIYVTAQNSSKADSLQAALKAHPEPDTTRIQILNELIWTLRANDPSQGLQYGREALQLGQKLGYKYGLVKTYSFMGVCARNTNNYGLAAEMYLKHLLTAEELGSEHEMFFAINNIGNLYLNQEDWANALSYLERNLQYAESKGTLDQRAYAYTNLGRCYSGLQQYAKAMSFFEKALEMQMRRKDTVRMVSIVTIGASEN